MSFSAPGFSNALCPLCHQSNQCALALGKSAEKCWCRDACIPPEVLATLPLAERGQRCVCAACAGTGAERGTAKGVGRAIGAAACPTGAEAGTHRTTSIVEWRPA